MGNKAETTRHSFMSKMGNWGNGITPGQPSGTLVQYNESFTRSGSDSPFYRDLIKKGVNATNPMTVTAQEVYFERCKCQNTWVGSVLGRTGQVIETDFFNNWAPYSHSERPPLLFQQEVGNNALIGLIKKIRKNESSDLSGPTFLGELRETLSMIRSPLKSLRQKTGLFTDLHMRVLRDKQARGGKFKPDPWRKVISDTWLEFTFGAAPLMSDISSIIAVYQNSRDHYYRGSLKRLSHRFTDTQSTNDTVGSPMSWAGINLPFTTVRHHRSSSQIVVWIDESLIHQPDSAFDWILNNSNFGLDEILPTAWERLPWSFLVDYFTNIGDIMGSTFDYQRNIAFGKTTSFNTTTHFLVPGVPVSVEPNVYKPQMLKPMVFTSKCTTVNRSVTNVLGFPQLSVSLPSLGQAGNIAALLSSLQNNNPFRGHVLK